MFLTLQNGHIHFCYTGKIFGEKMYTEKRVNYDKQILRQHSVNHDLLGQANDNRVYNYTPSVIAHLVCVKIKNIHKLHKVC